MHKTALIKNTIKRIISYKDKLNSSLVKTERIKITSFKDRLNTTLTNDAIYNI